MLEIDGAMGEGGGQILRTSLALSLVLARPVRLRRIRNNRSKPGLLRQHLTAVRAAKEVGSATVEGDRLGSTELVFRPREVRCGDFHFQVGSAGSAMLVLQTVLPALLCGSEASSLLLEGGTHNLAAPPFEFIARTFLPLVARMGPRFEADLERPGFFPAGGGRVRVAVMPAKKLRPFELLERGELAARRGVAVVSRLPAHVGERELEVLRQELGWPQDDLEIRREERSPGPGNVVLVELESEHITEVITSFGRRGVSAEKVAHEAVRETRAYLSSDAPVGEHLTDQLLLPMALAGEGAFRSTALSLHARTNLDVLKLFLDLDARVERQGRNRFLIELKVRRPS